MFQLADVHRILSFVEPIELQIGSRIVFFTSNNMNVAPSRDMKYPKQRDSHPKAAITPSSLFPFYGDFEGIEPPRPFEHTRNS